MALFIDDDGFCKMVLMRDRKWPQFIKIIFFREINFQNFFLAKMISRKNKEETSEENKF